MPLFEFICDKCNTKFETLVFSSEDKNIVCPKCNSKEVTKQLSVFSSSVKSEGGHCHGGDSCCSESKGHTCCNGCCGH